MMYVREALPLQEVAFLGRWKSNVVLTYAEEALERCPPTVDYALKELRVTREVLHVGKPRRHPKHSGWGAMTSSSQ